MPFIFGRRAACEDPFSRDEHASRCSRGPSRRKGVVPLDLLFVEFNNWRGSVSAIALQGRTSMATLKFMTLRSVMLDFAF